MRPIIPGPPAGIPGLPLAAPPSEDVQARLQALLGEVPKSAAAPQTAEEAAKDFAAILFGYMFSEMRPKEEEGGLLGGGDSELFMDFFDREIGRHFVNGAGGALVESLVEKLTKRADQE
ncbi:MAG: hypothetical protein FJX47_21750 [Alphaproteobacteria bacterium]|nr:hypothetical protein [Alphaproteobacteria bacterium]